MQNVYNCILEPLLFVHSRNSGKFPETAWRTVHSRQAAHAISDLLWVPEEESPGGTFPGRQATHGNTSFFWVL